jgi:hypothetical protein
LIESWKQSVLAAVVVIAAIVIGGGLQAWSLEHGPTPDVQLRTGIVLIFSGTTVVLTDGTRFELAPGARVGQRLPPPKASDLRVGDLVVVVGRIGIDTLLATSISLLPGRLIGGLTAGWTPVSNGDVLTIGSIDTVWPWGFRLTTPEGGHLIEYSTDTRFTRLQETGYLGLKPGLVITAFVSNGVAGFIQFQSAR